MIDPSRRDFLKSTTAAVAAGSVWGTIPERGRAQQKSQPDPAIDIPPHRAIPLDGVHAYADRLSTAAGETIRFFVSSTHPYELQICRLGLDVESPSRDQVLESWQVNDPVMQPIHPGSYIHVQHGLAENEELTAITLECWIRLWNVTGRQAVITQCDAARPDGYGLFVHEDRSVEFYLGGGRPNREAEDAATAGTLSGPGEKHGLFIVPPARQWHHVVAVFDGVHKRIYIDGTQAGQWKHAGPINPGSAPLRIGAAGLEGQADDFLDADIAMPAIYGRALSSDAVRQRFEAKGLQPPSRDGLLACWPLDEERGDRVADVSGHQRHGRIINHATWMIGGPSFGARVGQFADYDPDQDATRGHGLRLASDDLYDCRWNPTFECRIPEDARSGAYVGRIRFQLEDGPRTYNSLFVVKKAASAPKAPIAFVFSTNTWKAYSAAPFCPTWPGNKVSIGVHGYAYDTNDPKAPFCFYRHHRAGQPSYQIGMRMPWPAAGPYTLVQDLSVEFSHLCRADRFTQAWLEQEGYQYDAISDLDVHQDPTLLEGYKVLFIVGHSEYWSRDQYDHVRRYLQSGGNVICLSGNTLFWRVTFDPEGTVMECRKADGWGAQLLPEYRGECWHSHDRKRGGVPRECGFPAWKLIGVEFLSYNPMGAAGAGPFRVSNPDHFLFQTPQRLNLKKGDRFGFDPKNPRRQVLGDEGDVRVSTLMKTVAGPPPAGAPVDMKDPPGIDVLAEGVFDWSQLGERGFYFDYYHRELPHEQNRQQEVACEMIYWERPDGGRVFSASTISAGWPLAVDSTWANLLKNVLHHFGVRTATG